MIDNKLDGSGARLREFRKIVGKSQVELADILKTSHGHISGMEKDKKNITESTIELLKAKLNLNENFLRYGEGNPMLEISPEDENTAAAAELSRDGDKIAMQAVIEYWKLDEDSKKIFRDFLIHIVENSKNKE